MANFLDVAREEWAEEQRESPHGQNAQAFAEVFDGISRLQVVHSKARLDFQNIENIFAAFKMANLFGRLGDLSGEPVDRLVKSMRRLIVRTLERRLLFDDQRSGQANPNALRAPSVYDSFGKLMAKAESTAILTFNYDVALDYGLISNSVQIDYGLQPSYQPGSLPLLKLHGSLNFGRCKQCGVVAWPLKDYLVEKRRGVMPRPEYAGGGKLRFTVGSDIGHFRHSNHPDPCDAEPVVVPPTWNKGRHYPNIERVWKHAATELSEAEHLVLVGYSWPNSDEFFHHLYALGTAGPTLLQRVLVIDINAKVGERYRDFLFGEQARQRFQQVNATFEESMRDVLPRLIQPPTLVRF